MDTRREGRLELSANRKICSVIKQAEAGPVAVRNIGIYYYPADANSFGITSGETCPGKTGYCEVDCYADDCRLFSGTPQKLARNLELLRQQESLDGIIDMLRGLMSDYSEQADKLDIKKRVFRIHWSGDFFSNDYARAWRKVMQENPDIRFLVYTRSFCEDVNVLPILTGIDNLELYLSVDKYNVDVAAGAIKSSPDARVSYLVDYQEEADDLRIRMGRDDGHRAYACPEVMLGRDGNRVLPLISEKGGACSVCRYCLVNRGPNFDVVFVKTGLKHKDQDELPFEELPYIEKPAAKPTRISKKIGSVALQQDTLF